MRKNIVAGNWKMNCDLPQTTDLINDLKKGLLKDVNCELMIAPSHPFLYHAFNSTTDTVIEVVAQNVCEALNGAYTGEVSVDMLDSIGIKTVIIGHSERRDIYGETDELIAAKTITALEKGMRVIFCCGEHLEQRKAGNHFETVTQQIEKGLFGLTSKQMEKVVVAYEPVWAIGTGETASPEQAQEMHAHLRSFIESKFGKETANNTSILYGGSVKPANAAEIFAKPDVDGGLVGGASLDAQSFLDIANAF
ncbi:triose-phosphate isomerase [Nonlabens sp. MB-3u-79]|mgnify:CR=1 FL=1|uniref:triose-phosphate isomerase n=1 Tax=Nonlabens sp. MB-3u-79 TaxID=2058134 RepID=UPI000C308C75|nr:triose-phosphate isomerase [Nonlabens sp. MB-3u-79]AUC77966.1 triose-phosphate isomerase [Nonlabens sp. MB-3u-79]|tara:strand:+ start:2570 stop:3322 length:753 start_codon:yes stop_codon:yes gene_type:complete